MAMSTLTAGLMPLNQDSSGGLQKQEQASRRLMTLCEGRKYNLSCYSVIDTGT